MMSRRRGVVGGRRGVGVGFVAGFRLDQGFSVGQVLLQLPEIVVRQHHRVPAVRFGHGPLWTIGLACQMGGARSCHSSSGRHPERSELDRIATAIKAGLRSSWTADWARGLYTY